MTIETEIAGLTQATTDLLDAVNVRKATLDAKVTEATSRATDAANSATASAASAASALNIYGNTAAMNTAVTNASTSASNASASATNAANSATQAAASAASASQIVLGVASGLPNVLPSLNLDFANSKTVDPRITFSRASTATYYDGKTTAKAEENLLTYSQEFDNSIWVRGNVAFTANASAAPDGTLTADLLYPSSTGTFRGIYYNGATASLNTATAKVFSIYAKASGLSHIYLMDASTGAQRTWFNLSTGTVGTTAASHTASIVAVGDGWYRCIVSTSIAWSANAYLEWAAADVDNNTTATAAGTNGVLLWGAQLEQRSSVSAYTPTTTQPITNYIPALQTAAAGVPRIDHDPITGECKGLLIEEQRTNLLAYSEAMGSWGVGGISVAANIVISPDGTLSAEKIVEDTSNSFHYINRGFTATIGQIVTVSFYAKAAERAFVYSRISGAISPDVGASFNLSSGTVASFSAGVSASITHVGNGWYRCIYTTPALTGVSGNFYVFTSNSNAFGPGSNPVYQGDGFSGIYIWGAQVEASAFPTSYIKTEASQVTRSADSASMTGTNFSSWYRADEGSLYGEATPYAPASDNAVRFVAALYDTTNYNNAVRIERLTGIWRDVQTASGTSSVAAGTWNAGTTAKLVGAYANGNSAASYGGSATASISGDIPQGIGTLGIGGNSNGANNWAGHIKKIAYYPKRLSNSELQALTA